MRPDEGRQQHIVIVGGGAAGMSCAATLANHPADFRVTLLEKADVVGGQATSIPLDETRYGAGWMNNGVQGGSQIFRHSFHFFRQLGFPPQQVRLQVAFGKGEAGFWTNVFPSKLVQRRAGDIKRFAWFLTVIKWTMPLLGLVPVWLTLRLFFFSQEFIQLMVYPLIALFLGTGNQTPHVPSALVERLFDDARMKLWDYDPATLLPNLPTMYTFDHLGRCYRAWRQRLESQGVVVRTGTQVQAVVARSDDGVTLRLQHLASGATSDEHFDRLVLCVLADEALRILGPQASWRERFVLGAAAFYDDLTITHSDSRYFEQHYETRFRPDLCASPTNAQQEQQIRFARDGDASSSSAAASPAAPGFQPMYFTYSYPQDARLIEMSFNCSNYQHQLKQAQPAPAPVFQTIFLNKDQSALWTADQIDASRVIRRDWWHQLGHRWQHYLRLVPGIVFLQGRRSTFYAGSWTLVNMHEMACVSGIAAAYRLGADYVRVDDLAEALFSNYLLLFHGLFFRREERRRKRQS